MSSAFKFTVRIWYGKNKQLELDVHISYWILFGIISFVASHPNAAANAVKYFVVN
jgi:hypothetical protein